VAISVFDLFSIGIGPSSSHTVGPMRAARAFATGLSDDGVAPRVGRVRVELFGSLGATGLGHGTERAVILGLAGETPERVDVASIGPRVAAVRDSGRLWLLGERAIAFTDADIVSCPDQSLPYHPNGLRFHAFSDDGESLLVRTYFSVGGGFVVDEVVCGEKWDESDEPPVPHPFTTSAELMSQCATTGLSVSALMLANEAAFRAESEVRAGLLAIWQVMRDCVTAGCANEGTLPGGLRVARRAPRLFRRLRAESPIGASSADPLSALEWVDLFALAVNEENASGGRVVTAPTNGAAGVLPAVLHYYVNFVPGANDDEVVRFLLTAGAIGTLYKQNASISGAEVGCQGEVGAACSMAAGALCEVLGGTPAQVENAAEIGMEHNLGLTCDPVGGLVQVPCIERNAMAAVKAINAARLALLGDGRHVVSLDKVIKTMRDTGADMKIQYKETARGGLAVNVIEC